MSLGRANQRVCFRDGEGQRLFDQQMNPRLGKLLAEPVVMFGGGRNDGGVDLADQFAVVREGGRLGFGGYPAAGLLTRIRHPHELDIVDRTQEPRVNGSQMPRANDPDAKFALRHVWSRCALSPLTPAPGL